MNGIASFDPVSLLALAAAGVPLFSFCVCFLIGKRFSWIAPLLGSTLLFVSFILSIILFTRLHSADPLLYSWKWFSAGAQQINIGILLDRNSLLMLLVVMLVSWLVHLFSIGYMAEDQEQPRYFAMLGFFTFAMAGLVLSSNLLLTFCFWELVGFSSYRLIGHWYKKPLAAKASAKAFLINRVGDLGFLIAVMILWPSSKSLDIVSLDLASIPPTWLTLAGIGIFMGIVGKSAQFPLFNWLPDAMEGPTPVSALIHAATMVAAGVYLLSRLFFIFTPDVLAVIACVGVVTALLGATAALFQYDIKKVLAFSTISQLGFMVMAMGAGAAEGGFLHLLHHALFKAGLFLCAGAIIHAFHHTHHSQKEFDAQDIRNLGGLKETMPLTFWCFAVFAAALAGLPLTSGFVSKEMILTQMMTWAGEGVGWRWMVMGGAWLTTLLTPLYIFRLLWFVFLGKPRHETAGGQVPLVMRLPLVVLAAGSVSFMISLDPFHLSTWISSQLPYLSSLPVSLFSILTTVLALGAAFYLFKNAAVKPVPKIISTQFYLDWFSEKVSRLTGGISRITTAVDQKWLDSFLHGFTYFNVTLAHVISWCDRYVVDGLVNTAAYSAKGAGSLARSVVNGKIQSYFLWALAGLLIFILWILY